MKIIELLNKSTINLNSKAETRENAIDELVSLMNNHNNITNIDEYKKCVFEREQLGSTGVGEGVAIPHAKTNVVTKPGLSVIVAKDGIEYDSLDGMPAKLFFMIAAPNTKDNIHLDVLSRLSVLLMDDNLRNNLMNEQSVEDFLKLIDDAENKKFNDATEREETSYKILAVTACPTGIAHTFMAAEALENKAKEKGVTIKVETNGAGGIKNALTLDEIKNADCIIVAADKKVDMARFNGKKVIQTKVADGIHKAEILIDNALKGKANIYKSDETINADIEEESIGRRIYKHLMNGVSHMLPFVIGGGILIALAFLVDDFSIDPSNFGKNTPLAAFLKTVGEQAFGFMLPVLSGFIAMSIADRPALAVGFVGGALANFSGSGFLGALIAGFIAGYLIILLKKLFSKLPQSLEGIKPVLLYPLLGTLLIGIIMMFVVGPPVAFLNNSLNAFLNSMGGASKVLLGIILGAMMSIDFGGPINKAAYVFGTASIATGQFDIMAAVMIGGMVPPLSIALCTTFFKNKFTTKERQAGLTNYIMGLAFITEGAIPFAAQHPLKVIPACAIGSAVAGGLSMFFGATLRAPHGGIFVFPVVGNAMMYLLALIIGSIVGMLVLAMLKKPVIEK